MARMRRILPLIALAAWITPALAWSNKEHIQLTRIAIARLLDDPDTPPAMKDWLRKSGGDRLPMEEEKEYFLHKRVGLIPRGVDGIPYWAIVPDMIALMSGSGESEKKVQPFDVPERLLHYVDLEFLLKEENRRRYFHDLRTKPTDAELAGKLRMRKTDGGIDDPWKRAGMLPFRIDQCYAQLVKSIREKKLNDKAGQFPRDEHAAKWAGYLAHYLQDNTQPHHATEDYRSRAYFFDKRTAPNVHWDLEGRLMDDENNDYIELRREFWNVFSKRLNDVEDDIETEELVQATIEVALKSYDALPLIGVAAMKAYGQGGTPDKPEGNIDPNKFDAEKFFRTRGQYRGKDMTLMEMKAYQMAWAVKRTERLWRRAWEEGSRRTEVPG
jgi:hypothetical protein